MADGRKKLQDVRHLNEPQEDGQHNFGGYGNAKDIESFTCYTKFRFAVAIGRYDDGVSVCGYERESDCGRSKGGTDKRSGEHSLEPRLLDHESGWKIRRLDAARHHCFSKGKWSEAYRCLG